VALPDIMVAPTGARRGKGDHPAMPLSIAEITGDLIQCHAAGAAAAHVHVRDDAGRHSLDAGLYRELLAELAARVPGLAVQVSTEAAGVYAPAAQRALLGSLQPAWASVSLREFLSDGDESASFHALNTAAQEGTQLQFILYDMADLKVLCTALRDKKLNPGPAPETLSVLGRYGAAPATQSELEPWLAALSASFDLRHTAVCAFGPQELSILAKAHAQGVPVRVGFENNILDAKGKLSPSNAAQVRALLSQARAA